jgi:hypothetical protein
LSEDFDPDTCGFIYFNLDYLAKITKESDVNRIKTTICKLWRECGPIKRKFIEEATNQERSPEIKSMVGLIISRLNDWKTMDQAMRDTYSDETEQEEKDRKSGLTNVVKTLFEKKVTYIKQENVVWFYIKEITQTIDGTSQIIEHENPLHEAMQDIEFECYARNSGDFRKNPEGEWIWIRSEAIGKWTDKAKTHLEEAKKRSTKPLKRSKNRQNRA